MQSLEAWINKLIADDNIMAFYKSPQWMSLRKEVMIEQHNECQECLKHGKITKAYIVHHVNEVRKRPDLALSKYYVDADGNKQKQLICVCFQCHEQIHDKLGEYQKEKNADKFTNKEQW